MWLDVFLKNAERCVRSLPFRFNYDASQPRYPKGTPLGGQWKTDNPGSGMRYEKKSKKWVNGDGRDIDDATAKRLADLKIPKGWVDVRFNPDPDGDCVAVGTDAKNRQQSLYSVRHQQQAAAEKFQRIKKLSKEMDDIRDNAVSIMNNEKAIQSERDAAGVIALILDTGMRPGSDKDTKASYASYGASTLQGEHVKIKGKIAELTFVGGKSKGKAQTQITEDKAVVDYLSKKELIDGQRIFQTNSKAIRRVFNKCGAKDFKIKDVRTTIGTRTAIEAMKDYKVPKNEKELKSVIKAVATIVSKKLGNTPAVALEHYIDKNVFLPWETEVRFGKEKKR